MEVSQALSKLPSGCAVLGSDCPAEFCVVLYDSMGILQDRGKATVVLDSCHSSLPGIGSRH